MFVYAKKASLIASVLTLTASSLFAGHKGDLGTLVVVGDSLGAGFQNFSLYDSQSAPGIPLGGQTQGFAALVAQQAGVSLSLPLISYPGIPSVLMIDGAGNITRGTTFGTRESLTIQPYDISVPAYTLADQLSRTIDLSLPITNPIDALALQVLGTPPCGVTASVGPKLTLSAMVCAIQLKPTTIVVSAGNNDALQALTFGLPPTDPSTFAAEYDALLGGLSSTGAMIVVSTIPDVTVVPFLVPAAMFQTTCGFLPAGVSTGDYLVTNLVDPTQTVINVCTSYSIRPAALIATTQAAITAYNSTIVSEATKFHAGVVDVNGLLRGIAQNGYKVKGQTLTTAALGGIFSLDGLHPTNTGYAILANAYIDVLNSTFSMKIKDVNVNKVAKDDPLIPAKH